MSLVPPKFARSLWSGGLLLAALAAADAQQPTRRQTPRIEFTEPVAAVANSNAPAISSFNGISPKRPAFGLLDQPVRKPFDFFDAEDSLNGVPAHPSRSVRSLPQNSKRSRELLDRKKNWVFNTPEEVYGLPTSEELLNLPEYGPNGEEKEPKSSLERYVERMEKNRSDPATNRSKSDSLPDWLKPDGEESRISYGNGEKASVHSIFEIAKGRSTSTSANSDFTSPFGVISNPAEKSYQDFFNLRSSDSSSKPVLTDAAQVRRMQDFKQLLETRSPVSPSLSAGFDLDASGSRGSSPLKSPFAAGMFGRDSLSPQPAPQPSVLPSFAPTTTLPGASAPLLSAPPAAALSRSFTPPASTFELPKRKF